MLVTAKAQGRKLIESGTFHVEYEVASTSGLTLAYSGLKIIVKTKIVTDIENENLSVRVEGNDVIFDHVTVVPPYGAPVGLIVPSEIGEQSNGLKIFFSWFSHIVTSKNGNSTVITSYSLYEGEK